MTYDASQELPAGQRIDDYVIERALGRGSLGVTYLASDALLGRKVALRENLPAALACREPGSLVVRPRRAEDAGAFAREVEGFMKEAREMTPPVENPKADKKKDDYPKGLGGNLLVMLAFALFGVVLTFAFGLVGWGVGLFFGGLAEGSVYVFIGAFLGGFLGTLLDDDEDEGTSLMVSIAGLVVGGCLCGYACGCESAIVAEIVGGFACACLGAELRGVVGGILAGVAGAAVCALVCKAMDGEMVLQVVGGVAVLVGLLVPIIKKVGVKGSLEALYVAAMYAGAAGCIPLLGVLGGPSQSSGGWIGSFSVFGLGVQEYVMIGVWGAIIGGITSYCEKKSGS